MATTVRTAQAADYAEVLTLLKQAGLPSDGVQENFANFLVARDAEDDLVGCVGAEYHGELALLRSLAVSEAARGKGVGEKLNKAAIKRTFDSGARTLDLTSRPSREAANRLYQKLGFKIRETNVYRFAGDNWDA